MWYELCRQSEPGIYAVPYRGQHARRAFRLPDGGIVEAPVSEERCEAPGVVPDNLAVAHGGIPATIHHANLGLITCFLPLTGIYLLPDGDVAAVYGAKAVPIGAEAYTL
jgi:hypothetical protein